MIPSITISIDTSDQLGSIMGWQQQILEWFEIFGPASLALLSFTEAVSYTHLTLPTILLV